jgi:hypothetical protein
MFKLNDYFKEHTSTFGKTFTIREGINKTQRPDMFGRFFCQKSSLPTKYLQHDGSWEENCSNGWFDTIDELLVVLSSDENAQHEKDH